MREHTAGSRRPPARHRAIRAVLAAIAVGAALLGTTAACHGAQHPDGPSTASSAPGPATTSGPSSSGSAALATGVTFGNRLFTLSRTGVDQQLDAVVALHLHWIRVDLSWEALQPTSANAYDWSPMDTIVAAARERRLHVLGLLSYTPPWARAPGCTSFVCPPRSASQFARFAGRVVARYAPQGVRTYQVWNEPNIRLFWRNPDPQAYRTLLAAATSAIRAAARGTTVLLGGLAYSGTVDGDIAPGTFLRRACAHAACHVDVVGYDPYTSPQLPSHLGTPRNAWQSMFDPGTGPGGIPQALRAVGLSDTPIWVTGFGAPTTFTGSDDTTLVSPARQAAIVVDGLRSARAHPEVIGGYFVDTLRDSATGGTRRDHFGLEYRDGTHKPAFAALAAAAAQR